MADDDDLTHRISEAVDEPARASGDLGSFENRSIDDLIKADKYLSAKSAAGGGATSPKLLVNRAVPPGAT